MTALDEVATYLPASAVPIEDLASALELTPMQVRLFRRFHGFDQIRLDPDGTLIDLLLGAAAGLASLPGREHLVSYVLHARSMPVAAPYPLNPLHELSRELGLGHACAFTVTHHACATALVAIDLAGRCWLPMPNLTRLPSSWPARRPSPAMPSSCQEPRSSARRAPPAWFARREPATACSGTPRVLAASSTAALS